MNDITRKHNDPHMSIENRIENIIQEARGEKNYHTVAMLGDVKSTIEYLQRQNLKLELKIEQLEEEINNK